MVDQIAEVDDAAGEWIDGFLIGQKTRRARREQIPG